MLTINFIYTGESKQIRSLKWLSNRNKNRNMFQIITIFELLFIVNNVYSTLWIHRAMILFISISQIANVCYWNIQNVSAKKTLLNILDFITFIERLNISLIWTLNYRLYFCDRMRNVRKKNLISVQIRFSNIFI